MFREVNSKALQRTVTRFYQNLSNLSKKKQNGGKGGMLKWKSPREFKSMTYLQSGFELKNTSGRHAILELSKIGDVKIRYHREIPDEADIKEVTIKRETTEDWFVSFSLETDDADLPEKPASDSLETSNSIGIDLGILNYIHTSDGKIVDWLTSTTSTNASAVNNANCRGNKKTRTDQPQLAHYSVSYPLTTEAAQTVRLMQTVNVCHDLLEASVLRFGGQAACTVPTNSPDIEDYL